MVPEASRTGGQSDRALHSLILNLQPESVISGPQIDLLMANDNIQLEASWQANRSVQS